MAEKEFLEYKGKPIVRKGDTIYYGSTAEKYVIMMQVLSKRKVGKQNVDDKIKVQLIATDDSLPPEKRVLKTSDKVGLYDALDIGVIWLERALKD